MESYDDLGSKAERNDLSNQVMFAGKSVSLEEFTPNRAIVGTPDDCIREMQRIKDLIDSDYVFLRPPCPDPAQQVRELRLFAKEVMQLFH